MVTNTMTTRTQSNAMGVSDRVILLCAPVHDRLTRFTSALLENFPSLDGDTILCKFDSPLTYPQLLTTLAVDPEVTDVVVIFCGHGEYQSLQGPGVQPGAPKYSNSQSSFYNESFLELGPTLILAACCNASHILGRSFERKTGGRTFIGYDREIGFVIRGRVYADLSTKILHGAAAAMLRTTDIDDVRRSVEQSYKDAIQFFSPRARRQYKYGLMMRLYLRRQLEAIDFIRT